MLRQSILWLARNTLVKEFVSTTPVTSAIVNRYVPGEDATAAVASAAQLVSQGLKVTLDHLGEDTTDRDQATATVRAYQELLGKLSEAGLAEQAEVSVKLSAVGQALDGIGAGLSTENAYRICAAARSAGTALTLDMEDHTTTDRTLATLRELRQDFPETGAVLQAYLHRTPDDARALAHEGSRVRLCKGAYREPESVAHQSRQAVDTAYVRCLKILISGAGYPMIATHDPRLIRISQALATRHGRAPGDHEFQMLFGIRPDEQLRLARTAETVRVYLPYGHEWYGYLMRRLAERPSNLTFFARSLISKS